MAFGAIDTEVTIDGMGMLLLMNYYRRLPKSKQNDTNFSMVVDATAAEM